MWCHFLCICLWLWLWFWDWTRYQIKISRVGSQIDVVELKTDHGLASTDGGCVAKCNAFLLQEAVAKKMKSKSTVVKFQASPASMIYQERTTLKRTRRPACLLHTTESLAAFSQLFLTTSSHITELGITTAPFARSKHLPFRSFIPGLSV